MKKIIFSNIALRKEMDKLVYTIDGNKRLQTNNQVAYPINAMLPKSISKNDDVKVVLLCKEDYENNSQYNVKKFQDELNKLNESIGAKIEYVVLSTPYEETRHTHEKQLRDMIAQLEQGAEIIADVTYGPKPLPIIMFAMLNFAEKYFACKIQHIVYGKVDFITHSSGKTEPVNPIIYDLAPLYYLNNVTNSLDCNNAEEAIQALDILLNI